MMEYSKNMVQVKVNKSLCKILVFIAPIVILACFLILRFVDTRIYLHLLYEDRPVEILTAIFYLASTVLAFLSALLLYSQKKYWSAFVYSGFTVVMFFIFGEEISWGQRIFGIITPEFFMEQNSQQEISLHNLHPVQAILHKIYFVIGLLGGFLWIVVKLKRTEGYIFRRSFVPSWYLMTYFLPVFIFYGYFEFVLPYFEIVEVMGRDQEPAEFMLCLGFFLFLLENWLVLARNHGVAESKLFTADLKANPRFTSN